MTRTVPADVLEQMTSTDSLPTPPLVLTQINKVVNDPNTSAYDVAGVVSEDPSLAAKILKMVNSAFYGFTESISSVRQAIVMLGIESVRSLVMCAAVVDVFKDSTEGRDFQESFWRHSLAAAAAARVLRSLPNPGGDKGDRFSLSAEEAFSAGLLHDIGKMVMACHMPDAFSEVRAHPDFGMVSDHVVERMVLGTDHAAIGGLLAEHWKLPVALGTAIAHHHGPFDTEHESLVVMIHVADYLAHDVVGRSHEGRALLPDIEWERAAKVGVAEEQIEDLIERTQEEYGRSETFLQMVRA